jgi:hypothetical protein
LASLKLSELEGEIARRRGGGYSTPLDESGGRRVLAPYTDAVGRGVFEDMRKMKPMKPRIGGYASLSPMAKEQLAMKGITAENYGMKGMGMRGMGSHREKSSVGIHGNLLGMGMPPALMSQPFSANFQMASRLPPAFSPIFHSGM